MLWRSRNPAIRAARRLIVGVVGGTVFAAGLALLVLPGPAFLVIPLGLAILASEFVWAKRLLERVRERIAGPGRALPPPAAPTAPLDALVLAGARGSEDAFVGATRAEHRALIAAHGKPLLAHVLDALGAYRRIGAIRVSIDDRGARLAEKALAEAGVSAPAEWLPSASSPARSVLAALDAGVPPPLLVTTADHALLTADILDAFLGEAERTDADLVVGVVPKAVVDRRYPETKRTGLFFAGEALCGANLFLFRTPACREAALFWVRVESDRKRPIRLVGHFGFWATFRFAFRRLRFERALDIAGRRIGLRIAAVRIPIAEAAIDVDNLADLELAERILRERSG